MDAVGRQEGIPDTLRDVGEDDGEFFCYVVGVRETTDPDAWSLLFMEPDDDADEQDIALGLDTYCLVVDPGQATYHGGVLDWRLTSSELRLTLTRTAAETLGMPADARFRLDLSGDQLRILQRGLHRVFRSVGPRGTADIPAKPTSTPAKPTSTPAKRASRSSGSASGKTPTCPPVIIRPADADEAGLRMLEQRLAASGVPARRQGPVVDVLLSSFDDCAKVANALIDTGDSLASPTKFRVDGPGAEFTYELTGHRSEDTRMISGWLASAAFLQ